jgi:predicted phosphodiesterase
MSIDADQHVTPQSSPLFSFAVVGDTHLNPDDAQNTSPWRTNRLANGRTAFVVSELNRAKPSFAVHLGDIVHPLPADPRQKTAAMSAKRLFAGLNCSLHFVPGNHDVGDKPLEWMPADCVSERSILAYRRIFGPDWYAFDYGGSRFLAINSSLLNSGLSLEAEQKTWIETELAENEGQRIFVFTHYPPYVSRPDESSHYDNLDEPGRSWLLDLIARFRVEALFAGHVHNFFYNLHAGITHCYVLPSVTSLRQDYAEFFRVGPADEYGRNDAAKLGFFIVDVYPDSHVAHFVRTQGATREDTGAQAQAAFERPISSMLGVHLRHAWAEEIELPYNGPLDELSRKRVRNDYGLLALWDLGIRHLRVPSSDLIDERLRLRMTDLRRSGLKFTVFTFGKPDNATLDLMAAHRIDVHAWEIIAPANRLLRVLESVRERASHLPPIWFSKLGSHDETADSGKPFDHATRFAFGPDDEAELAELRAAAEKFDRVPGFAFKIDFDESIHAGVQGIADLSRRINVRATIGVKLAPLRSAGPPPGEHAVANRVAEAAVCAWWNPQLQFFLDTFQEIDRGYYMRPGLVDRRCNPALAGSVFRRLHLMLARLEPVGALCEIAKEGWRGLALQGMSGAGFLWFPEHEQEPGTERGTATPVCEPEIAHGPIRGPWIEITPACEYQSRLARP